MSEIINFPEDLEYNVAAERTEDFFTAARVLSDFINSLPLSHSDNDKLIALIVDQVNKGEVGAFHHGIRLGVDVTRYDLSHKHLE